MVAGGRDNLSSSSSPKFAQVTTVTTPLSLMIREWVSLHLWLGQLKNSLFDYVVHKSAECPAFYNGMLHIIMQMAEMWVLSFFLSGLSRNLIGF